MANLIQILAQELSLKPAQVQSALDLFAEGATVPFIARYRKERTGELDELQLRQIAERHVYLTELEGRKAMILEAVEQQGKLTDALKAKISACTQKAEVEDLYLPFRPKRRTRATQAREKGLEPLSQWIASFNQAKGADLSLDSEAQRYLNAELGVKTVADALQGAADILAEGLAEKAHLRAAIRAEIVNAGVFRSRVKSKYPEGTTKYEMYRNFQALVQRIAPHNLLALYRGEAEGILSVELEFDLDRILGFLEAQEIRTRAPHLRAFYQDLVADAFQRLIKPSLLTEIRAQCKAKADRASIDTFAANLRELLLASPAGMKPTLGVDPGFRTGCKVVALDQTGQFLAYEAIFPHQSAGQRAQAAQSLKRLIQRYHIELIAIGNGTASRETDAFVAEVIKTLESAPIKVMVNESGASIYSASEVAIAEFPHLDITVRGAISIARRLQDPLAELVKIDPKSIGVGQYQHDVDQKLLKQKLAETVESCVNYVGVDLNTASKELLTFVSGITPALANNIVSYRNQNGVFRDRKALLKVPKLGAKAFEQAAGFLRIRNGQYPLDNTAVHPESYGVVAAIAQDLHVSLTQPTTLAARLKQTNLKRYITDTVGEPTLRDILLELEKPGRDPRAQFRTATFKAEVTKLTDLKPGMRLEGIVTNVTNFGAFVDIGVHQDGLVHISQMANTFVSDPKDFAKAGQVVQVRVLEINIALKRISLSLKPDH
ncbi:S1 RNA-binding domain-containing protein [Synechococcales cyanobacterium C]|uniref:S1 RNA-binding domain-containing protein n=1 Tax=Petrachloros mirabilis ULC683 TaxID=2781853 RepID=A0A8K2A7S2_9CYAN|nr:Tex family protein [Petrachloros mirabilis]NCJ07219.1 S1 RNA-binding domain-containing protein [Petrachloros mirabilis ULC683]